MEISLYKRHLPNLVRELQHHRVAPDVATTNLYDEPPLLFSAEGYGVCLIWLRNPETGELSLLDLLDNDMLAAREIGLGGHASAPIISRVCKHCPPSQRCGTPRKKTSGI